MNPEIMTCQRFTAGIIYPPLQLQTVDLNRLYAAITERYDYQSLTHLSDGIRMANPNGDCFVQVGRVQVNEGVVHFQSSKEKTLDIFRTVAEWLHVRQFMNFGIKLTAFLPLDRPGAASEFVESNLLAVTTDQWALLGPGRKGAGLRIVLHQNGVHDVRIEPFYNDTSQLYIELDVQHPEPFNSLDGLEEKMDAVYEYLFGNLKDFLASFK